MNKRVAKTSDATRLDVGAWVQAGLDHLADHGVEGVKVETLAKRMGVTKGSFYHHFKDREALLAAMLADWRRRATLDIIDRLDRGSEAPAERLRRLLRLPMTSRGSEWGAAVELAIRLWGRQDDQARAALAEVDQIRLRYIRNLLVGVGVPEAEAPARAVLAYSYMRVAASLTGPDDDLPAACEAVLMRG